MHLSRFPLSRSRLALPALSALLLSGSAVGCYSYVPVPVAEAPVGRPVRARISAAQAEKIALILDREDRSLEGNLLEKEPDGMVVIAVPSAVMTESNSTSRGYQRIAVPREDLQLLELRQLDRTRTALVAGAGVAAITAAALGAFANQSPSEGQGRSGSEKLRTPVGVPLVLLRVRIP